ncbi:MAG: YdbL family protein [Xanthomonadales bacterium]|nr:YdbL family protein [Xanthomonadales bacterium]
MLRTVLTFSVLTALVACVTINVYFPEAAAEEAADRFIENVIGPEDAAAAEDNAARPQASHWIQRLNPLDLLFPAAHAQNVNIDINTPQIRSIQQRMEQRFQNTLRTYFNSGAVGLTNDAMVEIRDLSAVPLAERNQLKAAVTEENSDRRAVYREIAVANGHPEWEDQIRSTFASRWIANARSGWYYQNSSGAWVQK